MPGQPTPAETLDISAHPQVEPGIASAISWPVGGHPVDMVQLAQ
jgi:hypothetical protein